MKKKASASAGLTLLELMVSMAISATIISIALATWSDLNRHVFHQEHKLNIRNETARIAEEIALKLGRAAGVLWHTQNSIAFIEPNGGDTIKYAFDGKSITKNGTPVYFGVNGGSVTSFYLRNIAVSESEYMLLEITVSSIGKHNYRDTCRFMVNAKNHEAAF